jgi:hypothetical protein
MLMAKVLGFASAFAGRRRIVEMDISLRLRNLAEFFNSLLVLLSQNAAAFVEKNHIFEKAHFSACGGLRWVCQDRGTWRRGFRRLLMA